MPNHILRQPRIFDQDHVPCCIPAAFARALEVRTVFLGGPERRLSTWFINHCARAADGDAERPLSIDEVRAAIQVEGLALEALDGVSAQVAPTDAARADAAGRRLSLPLDEAFLDASGEPELRLRQRLEEGTPLVVLFHQSRRYLVPDPTAGGVLSAVNLVPEPELHAVCGYAATAAGLVVADSTHANFVQGHVWTLPWALVTTAVVSTIIAVCSGFSESEL